MSNTDTESDAKGVVLQRNQSLWNTLNLFIGIMIGSGIFISSSDMAEKLPNSGSVICMWMFIGVYSLLGSLCFAELGTCFPDSGGDFLYLKQLWPSRKQADLVAFLRLFIELFVIRPGTHAIFGLTISKYIIEPFWNMGSNSDLMASNSNLTELHDLSAQQITEIYGENVAMDPNNSSIYCGTNDKGQVECLPAAYWCPAETKANSANNKLLMETLMAIFFNVLLTYINSYHTTLCKHLRTPH